MSRRRTSPRTSARRKASGGGFWRSRLFRRALVAFVIVFLALAGWFLWDMPGPDEIKPLEAKPSITVEANDGTVIARYGGIKGDVVDVKDLPPHVVAAVLAIEDRRFYRHFGVDVIGFARAMFVNLREWSFVQGGSTITQQLAKNLFLTPDKTIRRKVQEALLAIQLDRQFDKDDILSAYMNRVYFGAGAYGIDAAARVYFDKSATELTLWEGAVLAGVLKAPSHYAPTGSPERAAERAKVVIAAMHDAGYLDEKKAEAALKTDKVKVAGGKAGEQTRYFADWIVDQIDDRVGAVSDDLVVRTTLAPKMQLQAERKMNEVLAGMVKKGEDAKSGPQAALVTMGEDGAVLALIGGRNYRESEFNRATRALRQPGSTAKTFVMLAALEAGADPNDVILDAPILEGEYRPDNHDGKYYGDVTLTDALALSLNTATIRTLQRTGINGLMRTLERMPFPQTFRPELATGLGAGETTLLDLTAAYAVIANGGFNVTPYAILEIRTEGGRKLYRHTTPEFTRAFSGEHMAALDKMLVQAVARGTGQGAQLSRGHVAGKTGTSQNYRDAWFVGYTDNLVTGVWMGRDDNQGMARVSGGGAPARWWRAYMNDAIGMSLPGFVTTFGRPSGGFFGFGGGGPQWGGDHGAVRAQQEESGFGSMLRYWSSSQDAPVRPDTSEPQYNR